MEKVVERSNILAALERVERNKGAPGVDGMTTQELRSHLIKEGAILRQELLSGTYSPQPVRRVEIPKASGGGIRKLGIPMVAS
jgi:retron-type reverse transcriptase